MWDVFLSYASEERNGIAGPLANALRAAGVRVWFDEFEIKPGMSIRESIDRGLAQSRLGIVLLSQAYFQKSWTQSELDGLFAKKGYRGRIIPIWCGITHDEVRARSPMLAALRAIVFAGSVSDVVDSVRSLLKDGPAVEPLACTLRLDKEGRPDNLDAILVEEMRLGCNEGRTPPFGIDAPSNAFFNGAGAGRLLEVAAAEDLNFFCRWLGGAADFVEKYNDLENFVAHDATDRVVAVLLRKTGPLLMGFLRKMEQGIREILTRRSLQQIYPTNQHVIPSIAAYVGLFYAAAWEGKARVKLYLHMETEPRWAFNLFVGQDTLDGILSRIGWAGNPMILCGSGWDASIFSPDELAPYLIPQLLHEAFSIRKLSTGAEIPESVTSLSNWRVGLG